MDNRKHKNRRKRSTSIALVVLTLILLLSGTYAWFHMVDALNKFEEEIKSVVLHDDYDKKGTEDGEFNKDVYVENTGGTALFVRIRLDEYMELAEESLVQGAQREDKKTWTPHMYEKPDAEVCEEEFHDYWEWELGGGEQLYTPAGEGVKNIVLDRYEGGVDNLDENTVTTKTPANTPMFLSDYLLLPEEEQEKYAGWLLDEEDGWAYWSQKLGSKEVTGLLLDSVTRKDTILSQYYYGINVIMEAVDETDVMTWVYGGVPKEPLTTADGAAVAEASDEAQEFLKKLSDSFHEITDEMSGTMPSADDYDTKPAGGDGYLDADEYAAYQKDLEEARISGTVLTGLSVEVVDAGKMTYEYGAPFDRDAIKVTATYEYKNSKREVTDYTLEKDNLEPAESANTANNVTMSLEITYTEKGADGVSRTEKATLNGITVTNPLDGITLDTAGVKKEFYTGFNFKYTGLKVYAEYKSGYKGAEIALTNCTITEPDMSTSGQKAVKVAYGGDEKEYQIEVKDFDLQELIRDVQVYDRIDIPIQDYTAAASGTATRTDTDGSTSTVTWAAGEEVADEITWIVIGVGTDARSGKPVVELVTEEMVTGHQFFTSNSYNWTTSTVRTYLTTTFRDKLPQQMRDDILEVEKDTPTAYNNTTPKTTEETIYLLSEAEVTALWPAEATAGRKCAYYSGNKAMDGTSLNIDRWWLRSPGTLANTARYVNCSTGEFNADYTSSALGVRPALTIEVK